MNPNCADFSLGPNSSIEGISPNEPPERYILGGKREQQSSPKTNTIPADRYLLARETETAIIAKTNPNPADFRFLARGEILRRKELALAS